MMLDRLSASATRNQAELDQARELRWVTLYSPLTGVSDSEARACWMFAPELLPTPELISSVPLDVDSQRLA